MELGLQKQATRPLSWYPRRDVPAAKCSGKDQVIEIGAK